MERYYAELKEALHSKSSKLLIDAITFPKHCYQYRDMRNAFLKKWLLRCDRWFTYPFLLTQYHSSLFHILDQSFAYLVDSEPKRTFLVTCHDLIPLKSLTGILPIKYPGLREEVFARIMRGLKRAQHIIAVSHATKSDLVELMGVDPDKITVVHSGLGNAFTRQAINIVQEERLQLRQRLGLGKNDKILLHVGADAPYKNTRAIVKALPKILSDQNVWFLKVGSCLPSDELRSAAQEGVDSRIISVGYVSSDLELARYYRACDLLLFPSVAEGFGWPPLECMASGTPVIVSSAPALKEVVDDAGLIVEPDDYAGLAESVAKILTDSQLRNHMVERGIQQSSKFKWSIAAEETLAVYKKVLAL